MKSLNKIGIFSASLLITVSAVYIFAPVIGSHADTTQEADINLNIASGIGIRTSAANVNLNATVGSFVHNSVNVDVATNSQYGYTLTLEDKDSSSSMTATGISSTVTSDFSGKKTSTEMEDNTWGFSLDTTDYYKVPTNGNPVALKRTNTVMTTDYETTTVDFGAKVGMYLTAGTYSDVVVFTAYVNGQDGKPSDGTDPDDPGKDCVGIFCISTMQEMTPAICAENTTPNKNATSLDWDGTRDGNTSYVPRTRLRDTRDNNYYIVSKLADGNCWMSQNLALDFTAGVPIEVSNNDGTVETVTPNMSIQDDIGVAWDIYDDNWRGYHPKADESYFRSGTTMGSYPTVASERYDWEKTGNYYNWYAATAGTGLSSMTHTEVNLSICPKGWRLPNQPGTKSYQNLLVTVYGITNNATGARKLRTAPHNYILAGWYNYYGGVMSSQGEQGDYRTAVTYSWDVTAYALQIGANSFGATNTPNKAHGFNVRCVAI